MNLCDVNVWLALALSRHVHHTTARRWFDQVAEPNSILFCRSTQQTLLRLLTNASVFSPYGNPPLSNAQAWAAYEAFAADDRVTLRVEEPPNLEAHWKTFASRKSASPKLWMDAYLAAFAIAAGLRLVTTDVAFRQFSGLEVLLLTSAPTPRRR